MFYFLPPPPQPPSPFQSSPKRFLSMTDSGHPAQRPQEASFLYHRTKKQQKEYSNSSW